MQQAIDAGADFIASTGVPRSLYEEQAMAAKEAGIKMLSCFDAEAPGGDETNIYMQCGDATFVAKTGALMADWTVVDSEGAANVLIVSIPDFTVLKGGTDAYIAELGRTARRVRSPSSTSRSRSSWAVKSRPPSPRSCRPTRTSTTCSSRSARWAPA